MAEGWSRLMREAIEKIFASFKGRHSEAQVKLLQYENDTIFMGRIICLIWWSSKAY